jgi:hypothetical protein
MEASISDDDGCPEEVTYSDPGQEARTAGPSFVPALSHVLQHMVDAAGRPQRVTRFHAIRAPQLSVADYLSRMAMYFQCSNECFVLALIYIDRIVKLHPEFTISLFNIHRLLVTSVMLGAKFFDDLYYSNAYYAKVGGVRTSELNALEAQFLRLIEWKLHVLPQEYDQYRNHVLNAVRGNMAPGFTLYQQPQLVVDVPYNTEAPPQLPESKTPSSVNVEGPSATAQEQPCLG